MLPTNQQSWYYNRSPSHDLLRQPVLVRFRAFGAVVLAESAVTGLWSGLDAAVFPLPFSWYVCVLWGGCPWRAGPLASGIIGAFHFCYH